MPQSCIPRIRQMEEIYDRIRKDIATLREYEESGQWLQDYEADEMFRDCEDFHGIICVIRKNLRG